MIRSLIDIGDALFMRWFAEQPDDTRADFEVFWRREVVRHPYIRNNPENAAALRTQMVLIYATDQYDYSPRRAEEFLADSLT